jgi:hypothetical protein
MEIDMEKRTLSFWVDEENCGVAHNIPESMERVYPVFSLSTATAEVTITRALSMGHQQPNFKFDSDNKGDLLDISQDGLTAVHRQWSFKECMLKLLQKRRGRLDDSKRK